MMKKSTSLFTVFCTVIFLAFTIFMIWFVPSYASVRSKISETRRELDLSRGREAKQQAEYDSAVAELPLILSELEEKNPAADKAEEALAALKARKKELRIQKQELEKAAAQKTEAKEEDTIAEEASSHE
jgi:chromosome segregation ATPase